MRILPTRHEYNTQQHVARLACFIAIVILLCVQSILFNSSISALQQELQKTQYICLPAYRELQKEESEVIPEINKEQIESPLPYQEYDTFSDNVLFWRSLLKQQEQETLNEDKKK